MQIDRCARFDSSEKVLCHWHLIIGAYRFIFYYRREKAIEAKPVVLSLWMTLVPEADIAVYASVT